MRQLMSTDFTSTTLYDNNYYNDDRQEQEGPSYVLIVGLTMAFVGATILIVVICCVCRKRQPPDSQGAMYERAATSDGQSAVTSYPLGPVHTGSTPSTQLGTTVSKTTSTAASQMSGGPPQPHPQMYMGHGHQPYPGYPHNAANMGPPYIYPVPQPNFQPMTTLAVFGAPDGAPQDNAQSGGNSTTPLPYSMYPTGGGEVKQPGQDMRQQQHQQQHQQQQQIAYHLQQEHQRQMSTGVQQFNTNQQQASEYPWQQPSAPPPPPQM